VLGELSTQKLDKKLNINLKNKVLGKIRTQKLEKLLNSNF
jgi:hypothetical protein